MCGTSSASAPASVARQSARLPRRSVDEVEVQTGEARVARERDGQDHVRGIVRSPERGEHVRRHRLHPEAQPVDAGPVIGRELGGVDAVGVALDGDLGIVGPFDRVEDAHQLIGVEQRRRPSAEEHTRRRRVALAATPLDVRHARIHVRPDEMPAVRPRREVAVVTPRRAERNVNVDAERHAVRLGLPARSGCGWAARLRPRVRS